ncbi:MAG TPA: polyprenyl synthetase family protein [Tepidisphaeraceae bacterium]
MKLLAEKQLEKLETHLDGVTSRLLSARGLASLNEMLRVYVARGGKRIRPQLTVWTYQHATSTDELPSALLDVAAAWELFHAFLLIHDDIIDGSDKRRAYPSLHRQLQSLDSNSPRFGVNLGIVAGDLMYAATLRVLAELDVPAEAYRGLHRLFSSVSTLTGFGQAIDILQSHADLQSVDEETLLREYHWKTAAYTFEGPMLSAAILAGLSDAQQEAISQYALSLGQAYQLQNDLIDLAQPASEGCDLVEGKRTITLLRARSILPAQERPSFDGRIAAIQSGDGNAVKLAEAFRRDLLATSAVEQTRDSINGLLNASATAAADQDLPPALGKAMEQLLGKLQQSYFAAA